MSVTFLIRRDDVARFLEMAESVKVSEGMEWTAFITVKEKQVSFRAGPTTCMSAGAKMDHRAPRERGFVAV